MGRKSYILVDYFSHRAADGKNSFSLISLIQACARIPLLRPAIVIELLDRAA